MCRTARCPTAISSSTTIRCSGLCWRRSYPFCGEGLAVLAVSRLLMLLMAAGIAWLTWRISRLAGGSAETAWLAVVILFANFLFIPCVMEIRPDIPMVLLALAAAGAAAGFYEKGKADAAVCGGISCGAFFPVPAESCFFVSSRGSAPLHLAFDRQDFVRTFLKNRGCFFAAALFVRGLAGFCRRVP